MENSGVGVPLPCLLSAVPTESPVEGPSVLDGT